MLGAGLQFNRTRGENDRIYFPSNVRRNYYYYDQNNNNNNDNNNNNHINNNDNSSFNKNGVINNNIKKNPKLERAQSDVVNGAKRVGGECRGVSVFSGYREPENRTGGVPKPVGPVGFEPAQLGLSNLERFLEAITPYVHAQYLSKTTMRGLRTCDVEYQPYFVLSDLWDSFKEWSAYGAGVPFMLSGSDSVVQYYVPYLSGIQIYVDASKSPVKSRRTSEDSDDYFSRDSSSDGSSDSERDRTLTYSGGQQNPCSLPSDISSKMERLLTRNQHEGSSSDDGECGTTQGSLLFQYLEQASPFSREPLADKISDLALKFPALKSLRSCDILSSSWLSVAWYPIYRIPTGPTLKDLEACFLTYHSLGTPAGDAAAEAPVVIIPNEIGGIPRMSLPVYGLSTYKFRGPLWASNNGRDHQLANSLLQVTDRRLSQLQVKHPDHLFFTRNR